MDGGSPQVARSIPEPVGVPLAGGLAQLRALRQSAPGSRFIVKSIMSPGSS